VRPHGDDFLGHLTILRQWATSRRRRPEFRLGNTKDVSYPTLEADSSWHHALVGPSPHRLRVDADNLSQMISRHTGVFHRFSESVIAHAPILAADVLAYPGRERNATRHS